MEKNWGDTPSATLNLFFKITIMYTCNYTSSFIGIQIHEVLILRYQLACHLCNATIFNVNILQIIYLLLLLKNICILNLSDVTCFKAKIWNGI